MTSKYAFNILQMQKVIKLTLPNTHFMNMNYTSPNIEIIEVAIESGFALSEGVTEDVTIEDGDW